jgi:Helix-turn-helix domain of resolvase
LAEECIESIFDWLVRQRIERPLEQSFLSIKNLATVEPWRSLALRNTPGPLPSSVPVFLAQGAADELVRPSVTENYMTDLCRTCQWGVTAQTPRSNGWPTVSQAFPRRATAPLSSTRSPSAFGDDGFAGWPDAVGRRASIDAAQVRAMKADGLGASEIAKALKIGRASVYRVLDAG